MSSKKTSNSEAAMANVEGGEGAVKIRRIANVKAAAVVGLLEKKEVGQTERLAGKIRVVFLSCRATCSFALVGKKWVGQGSAEREEHLALNQWQRRRHGGRGGRQRRSTEVALTFLAAQERRLMRCRWAGKTR
jgi:hypothetical protein